MSGFIEVDTKGLKRLTSLKKTVEAAQDLDCFLQLKQDIGSFVLRFSMSREQMLKDLGGANTVSAMFKMKQVFLDLSNLMRRAVEDGGAFFRSEDFKLLEGYRRFNFTESWLDGLQVREPGILIIPGTASTDKHNRVYAANLGWLNAEVDRRFFEHVLNVLIGEEEVRVCPECSKLFAPRRQGKPQRYCSPTCRSRVSSRKFIERKRQD